MTGNSPTPGARPFVTRRPADFIELTQLVPALQVDLRYFNGNNFLGCRADGYEAQKLLFTERAGRAIASISVDLQAQGLGLKVFDAYRPARAVAQFMHWAADEASQAGKAQYFPHLDKPQLIAEGYLLPRSAHSRGSTIDLTLVDALSGEELDMGTPFDFFDPASWPGSDLVTSEQKRNRMLLQQVMTGHGFEPLDTEWWHFSFMDEPYPDTWFDFPIR